MKGISDLISATLLVVLTISIAAIVFTAFTSNVSSTTEQVENKSSEAVDCTAASINIEDVFITNGSAGSARVIVRNTGFSTVSLSFAQLYNKTGHNFTAAGVPLAGFGRGHVANLAFGNVSVRACPGDFGSVIITTNCGGISDSFEGTPKCT